MKRVIAVHAYVPDPEDLAHWGDNWFTRREGQSQAGESNKRSKAHKRSNKAPIHAVAATKEFFDGGTQAWHIIHQVSAAHRGRGSVGAQAKMIKA